MEGLMDEISRVTQRAMLHRAYVDAVERPAVLGFLLKNNPPRPVTFWQRRLGRVMLMWSRVRDAWKVLSGRAEVGDW
jgi:hypothetical protein